MWGGSENGQSELLHVGNFRGLRGGTAESLLDGIFDVQEESEVPKGE